LLVEYVGKGTTSDLSLSTTTLISAEIINTRPPPEYVGKGQCVWCGKTFSLRTTGGSAQRFCSLEHRKAFWNAARRWTMRAIEAGFFLTVECLKGHQTSVHAAGRASVAGDRKLGDH